MADKVQRVMEDMVPELLDLGKRKVFSKDEIREIVRRRRDFEYKIASRTPTLRDYLEYLSYEYELERIRNIRTRALKLKKRTIGDYSIVRLIHFIFKRALRRFPSDEKLWLQNIDFCLKSGSSKALQRILISALRHNPANSVFWLIMSDREFQNGNAKEARSTILLGLRVNKDSLILWRGLSQLETNIAYKKYLDCFTSSELAIRKELYNKNSSIMSLVPILSHGLKKIKLEYKKDAHILFILRQYLKLHQVLSESGDFSRIQGMDELEGRILSSFNQSKESQPLFPVFGIILGILKSEQADLFGIFVSEISHLMQNCDAEFALIALIFVCRLIYNCTSAKYLDGLQDHSSKVLSEAINSSSIVDLGFEISDSIQGFDDHSDSATVNGRSKTGSLHLNMATWYAKTCLENLSYKDNHHIKRAVGLLKLDPNLWNCCFLEGLATEELIQNLSPYLVSGIEEREIWREKLLSKEQMDSIKEKVVLYLSSESNKTRMMQLMSELKEKVQDLNIKPEYNDVKLSLLEALDSLFNSEQCTSLQGSLADSSIHEKESLDRQLLQSPDNTPEIIRAYKQFIIRHGASPVSAEHVTLVIQTVNRILDLINIQVENDEVMSEGLDFIGFSKAIFWTLYIININYQELNEKHTQDLLRLRERIVSSSLNTFPLWLSINKVSGFLFNVLIIYSVTKATEKTNGSFQNLLLDYLNSSEEGLELRFESSPMIYIIQESLDDGSLIGAAEVLLELSKEHGWLLTNDITMAPKSKKDATSITFMLACISLLLLSFERYLKNCISFADKPLEPQDLTTQAVDKYMVPKLFTMLNNLSNYAKDFDNFSSDEYKVNINVRYLLLIKLVEHLKVKRILSPRFGESPTGLCLPTFSGLLNQLHRDFPYLRSGKLPSGVNLATISTLSVDDPLFELSLRKVSALEENPQEVSDESNSHPRLYKVMQNILNPCQLLAPTSAYFKNSFI